MARLPYVDPATAPEEIRRILERLPDIRIFRMVAHAEGAFRPFLRLGSAILGGQELPARLRELAILRVANLCATRYEWTQHVAWGRRVGLSEAQIEALERGIVTSEAFDEEEQLVLRFTTEVVEKVRASDETFREVARRFTPREVVELVLTVGYYMMVARLLETTGVDLDLAADPSSFRGNSS